MSYLYSASRLCLFLTILVLFSCTKNEPTVPYIEYSTPSKNEVFTQGDEVLIKGVARDDQELMYFEMNLINDLGDTVMTLDKKYVFDQEYAFSHSFIFDNKQIRRGRYNIATRLDGAHTIGNYTQPIQLGANAGQTRQVVTTIYDLFQQSKYTTYIDVFNLQGILQGNTSIEGEFIATQVLGNYLYVILEKVPNLEIHTVDLTTYQTNRIWQSSTNGSVQSLAVGASRVYFGFTNQQVLGFDENGQNYTLNLNRIPIYLTENGDHLFVYARDFTGSNSEMQVFHSGTGGFLSTLLGRTNSPLGICSFSTQSGIAYYLGPGGFDTRIFRSNFNQNNTSELFNDIPASVWAIPQEAVVINQSALFPTTDRGIYSLSTSEVVNEVFPSNSFQSTIRAIRYDGSQYMGVVSSNKFDLYNADSFSPVNTFTLRNTSADAHVVVVN